ncbi:MAG: hypothetical protein LIO57_09180 [Oscillospiraceae bacterium]|nr:hypothetical protein [Oscillospiraceae bacterium]
MGGTGNDWFVVQWVYEELCRASVVDPSYPPMMTDITKWCEQVEFPNLASMDFKGVLERELSSSAYNPNKLNQACIHSDPFERLLYLMGSEDALASMLLEPDACREFFDAVIDYKIELIDRLAGAIPSTLSTSTTTGAHRKAPFSLLLCGRNCS